MHWTGMCSVLVNIYLSSAVLGECQSWKKFRAIDGRTVVSVVVGDTMHFLCLGMKYPVVVLNDYDYNLLRGGTINFEASFYGHTKRVSA